MLLARDIRPLQSLRHVPALDTAAPAAAGDHRRQHEPSSLVSPSRGSALVLVELGCAAFFAAGIAQRAIGDLAPIFLFGAVIVGAVLRAVDLESTALFVPGGLYGMTAQAFSRRVARVAAAALLVEHALLAALAASAAGHLLAALVGFIPQAFGSSRITVEDLSMTLAVGLIGAVWLWMRSGRAADRARHSHGPGRRGHRRPARRDRSDCGGRAACDCGLGRVRVTRAADLARTAGRGWRLRVCRRILRVAWPCGSRLSAAEDSASATDRTVRQHSVAADGAHRTAVRVARARTGANRLARRVAGGDRGVRSTGRMGSPVERARRVRSDRISVADRFPERRRCAAHAVPSVRGRHPLARMRVLHPRLGTPTRLVDLSALGVLAVLIAGAGQLTWLANAFAVSLICGALLKIAALVRFRRLRPEARAFRVPVNVRFGSREWPVGLAVAAVLAGVPALMLLASGNPAALAGVGLLVTVAVLLKGSQEATRWTGAAGAGAVARNGAAVRSGDRF